MKAQVRAITVPFHRRAVLVVGCLGLVLLAAHVAPILLLVPVTGRIIGGK